MRYVSPRPAGVALCLGRREPDLERNLFEYVLMAAQDVTLDLPALGAALSQPVAAIARALFALNRDACIGVDHQRVATGAVPGKDGLAGIARDLGALTRPGQGVLLGSHDGLLIAHAGWARRDAEMIAAGLGRPSPAGDGDHIALRFGPIGLCLCASSPIDRGHPALLRLGRRLLGGTRGVC